MQTAVGEMVGKSEPGMITGMKGTTPLTPLSDAFIARFVVRRPLSPGIRVRR